MMVPFTSMVIWTFQEKVGSSWKKILWYSGKVVFIFSISMLQIKRGGCEDYISAESLVERIHGLPVKSIEFITEEDQRKDA